MATKYVWQQFVNVLSVVYRYEENTLKSSERFLTKSILCSQSISFRWGGGCSVGFCLVYDFSMLGFTVCCHIIISPLTLSMCQRSATVLSNICHKMSTANGLDTVGSRSVCRYECGRRQQCMYNILFYFSVFLKFKHIQGQSRSINFSKGSTKCTFSFH